LRTIKAHFSRRPPSDFGLAGSARPFGYAACPCCEDVDIRRQRTPRTSSHALPCNIWPRWTRIVPPSPCVIVSSNSFWHVYSLIPSLLATAARCYLGLLATCCFAHTLGQSFSTTDWRCNSPLTLRQQHLLHRHLPCSRRELRACCPWVVPCFASSTLLSSHFPVPLHVCNPHSHLVPPSPPRTRPLLYLTLVLLLCPLSLLALRRTCAAVPN